MRWGAIMTTDTFHARERLLKSIRLERRTIEAVEKTAQQLDTSFTRTVEYLLRRGLQYTEEDAATLELESQRQMAKQGTGRALNQYLQLLSQAVITANEAKEMAQQVFFVQLRQLADDLNHPDQIHDALALFPEEDAIHEALYTTYKQRQQRSHDRAVTRLQQTCDIEEGVWQQFTHWTTDSDQAENPVILKEIETAIEQTVRRQMDRYLKLLAKAVIAADEAKETAQQIFFLQLRQLAKEIDHPHEVRAATALNSKDALHSALYDMYKQRQKRGRNRAVRQLKGVIDIDSAAWQQLVNGLGGQS
jgi:hypothetical protein